MKYKFERTSVTRDKREMDNFSGKFTGFNSFNGGTNETIENSTFDFDMTDDNIPVFKEGDKFVEIKAVEDILVKSVWKGFLGLANSGINNIANAINKMFNGGYKDQNQLDLNESFMPTLIHTGIKCLMPRDEIMFLSTYQDNGIVISGGSRIYAGDSEIIVPVYNVYPGDIQIKKGDTVAIATFHVIGTNNTNSINLNKE